MASQQMLYASRLGNIMGKTLRAVGRVLFRDGNKSILIFLAQQGRQGNYASERSQVPWNAPMKLYIF